MTKDEFRSHGYLGTGNWGGLEVEVDEAGETLRVRDGGRVGRWQKIYFNRDGSMYFIRHGLRWRLDEFMRA